MPASQRTLSAFEALPLEVKVPIASRLSVESAVKLARVSRSWQDAAESRIYRRLVFEYRFIPYKRSDDDKACEEFDPRWRRVVHSLRAHPARAAHVREVHAYPMRLNAVDLTEIIERCRGSLLVLCHPPEDEEQGCKEESYLSRCLTEVNKPLDNLSRALFGPSGRMGRSVDGHLAAHAEYHQAGRYADGGDV